MNNPTSPGPRPATNLDKFERELSEITEIYQRAFDDRKIDLLLLEGRKLGGNPPVVLENDPTLLPPVPEADILGRVSLPPPFPHARPISAALTIPLGSTSDGMVNDTPPWHPRFPLQPIFRLWPMLYERIRYTAEMARKMLSERHKWAPLIFKQSRSERPALPSTDKRPAIIVGFYWLEVGGAEKMAFDTVNWALEAGLRVFVVANTLSEQRLANKLPNHPDVIFIRLDLYLPAKYWPHYISKLICDENVRIIHIHHCHALYESLPHIRDCALPVTVIDTTHIVEYANGGFPRISGIFSNYIDLHHVISKQLVTFFSERLHDQSKIRFGRMLTRETQEKPISGMSLQHRANTLNIAFIGRYTYQKRPIVVIEIVRKLAAWARQHKVEISARLVGDGPFRSAAEALARRYGLQSLIEFLPSHTDVPSLLEQSDILLLPSNNEGLALVCYEAIQHGCIPISTDVGAQHEIIPPDLLVALAPGPCVRKTVSVIDKLWADKAFLAAQSAALQDLYRKVSSDTTARDVLMPIYTAVAKNETVAI